MTNSETVPRIHAIIETAMRNGASLYHAKGFTEFENDLDIPIFRLGGRSLAYAMNQALKLPSLRTICNSVKFIKITPTIGPISKDEIRANIQNVMPIPYTARRACYFSHANQVGGLCQKHSTIPLNLATHDSALRIVDELGAERVHFGKEMDVLCAPTCKETWEDMVSLFNLIIEFWAEKSKDEIKLGPGDKVYFVLSNIPALNLFTGPCRILITFDWRNIIKRHCTLLRHVLGIAVDNGHIVGLVCLHRCLLLLPGQDAASVESLLNPNDPQDILRAIDLLEAIVVLRTPHFVHAGSTAATNSDLDAITLLSFVLDTLLNVFTLLSASLSQQIYHLSIYAHMSFILFRTYRLKFMSNQLYGDSQSMVKNIVFTVAKQQELDPNGEFSHLNCAMYEVQAIVKSNQKLIYCDPTVTGYILESLKA
ncbi:hypothetical protein B0H13DRAFT_2236271 [Mycena leptocephala]|nr:hypothetical protein B0H13DRAFT_2236271 [Mycena leptocephala]